MPWSALPPHLNSPDKWKGTDNDTWLMKWTLKIKGFFAFGPLSTEWWGKWREIPKVLFAIRGKGFWRWEYTAGGCEFLNADNPMSKNKLYGGNNFYLSRVQYYTRWHFAVQWPLQVTFHIYWKEKDIPAIGGRPSSMDWTKMFFMYGPTHRDADRVYWMPDFFVGGTWK